MLRRLLIGLAALLLLAAIALQMWGYELIVWQARSRLTRLVGSGDWQVTFANHNFWTLALGHGGDIHIEGRGIALHNEPTADVAVDLTGVRTSGNRLIALDSMRYTLTVDQNALNAWLATRRHELQPDVVLEPATVSVSARDRLLHRHIPGLLIEGKLAVDQDVTVRFTPAEAQVGRFSGGTRVLDFIASAVNPVLDLRTYPFGLTITHLDVQHAALTLSGEGHPPLPLSL